MTIKNTFYIQGLFCHLQQHIIIATFLILLSYLNVSEYRSRRG